MSKTQTKRPTIRDVARVAGVHASTVSRVLSPGTRRLVSDAVAQRIERVARRLGYRPDPVAAGLRAHRSRTVGILVPDLANPVFPLILRGIEAALLDAGYTAVIANTDNDSARAHDALRRFAGHRVEGVICATATLRDPNVRRCRTLGMPIVLVNRMMADDATSAVINDDEAGIALAVDHLAALGHRLIGHVAGPASLSTGRARSAGYAAALRARGLPVTKPAHAKHYDVGAGARACERLLDLDPRLTAIVAANDLLALGCYDELARRGLRCPDDISVTGFNDMAFADRFAPPLTTVRIPHRLMGVEAARMLLAEIADPRVPRHVRRLGPDLLVRGSTGSPRG
jgi:LacI family transcriptional regulator